MAWSGFLSRSSRTSIEREASASNGSSQRTTFPRSIPGATPGLEFVLDRKRGCGLRFARLPDGLGAGFGCDSLAFMTWTDSPGVSDLLHADHVAEDAGRGLSFAADAVPRTPDPRRLPVCLGRVGPLANAAQHGVCRECVSVGRHALGWNRGLRLQPHDLFRQDCMASWSAALRRRGW